MEDLRTGENGKGIFRFFGGQENEERCFKNCAFYTRLAVSHVLAINPPGEENIQASAVPRKNFHRLNQYT